MQSFVVFTRSHAEIDELDISDRIQKDVLRLDVSMTDFELVTVAHSTDYLSKYAYRFIFLEVSVLNDVIKELATFNIFHDEISNTV